MNKIRFDVQNVEKAKEFLFEEEYSNALEEKTNVKLEAFPTHQKTLVPIYIKEFNGFVATLWFAFKDHRPVIITPDIIWLLICQGFANHVSLYHDKLRNVFINHEGKQKIKIREDSFIKGKNNNWETVFCKFSEEINRIVNGNILSLLVPEFSTTGSKEKATFELTLMDAMSNYFEYETVTICGIPEITLIGEVEDWEKIMSNFIKFRKYGLDWWVDSLLPVLEKLLDTSKGNIDKEFWQSIYNYHGGSGGPTISGWVLNFFPYTKHQLFEEEIVDNELGYEIVHKELLEIDEDGERFYEISIKNQALKHPFGNSQIAPYRLPNGVTMTDFKWSVFDKTYDMVFVSGFLGINQDKETFALSPEISWGVGEKGR